MIQPHDGIDRSWCNCPIDRLYDKSVRRFLEKKKKIGFHNKVGKSLSIDI